MVLSRVNWKNVILYHYERFVLMILVYDTRYEANLLSWNFIVIFNFDNISFSGIQNYCNLLFLVTKIRIQRKQLKSNSRSYNYF